MLGEVPSHFNLTKESGEIEGRGLRNNLVDGSVDEAVGSFVVTKTPWCLCRYRAELGLEGAELIGHVFGG